MHVCIGLGQRVLGIHWLIKLANSETFMKAREKHKTGKANYVQIVTGHDVEQRGSLVPGPGMETDTEVLGKGRYVWRRLMILQGRCQGIGLERPLLMVNCRVTWTWYGGAT